MFGRKREVDDFNAEIEAHLKLETERLQEQGLSYEEARAAAHRAFGNVTKAQERFYESGRWMWWDRFRQDIRFGLRMLAKSPGFTAVAVLTLALGIGANTAMFGAVQAVLLRPLPFRNPERLVDVWLNNPKHGVWHGQTSYPEFLDWKKQNSVFESMAVYRETNGATLSGIANPVRLHAAVVSPGLFDVLGVNPRLGGIFLSEQDVSGKANVIAISYALWRAQFQSDPSIIGRSVTISGKDYTILAVMPRGFQFPILAEPIDAWIPLAAYDGTMPKQRGAGIYSVLARLRPGIRFEQATAQINAIENRLAVQYPKNHTPGDGANVSPLLPDLVSGTRDALLILFGAVAIVLLIACANVANLMILRATGRFREFAIRRALGACRVRLVRQLLTESVLLAALGGCFGLVLAYWVIGALVTLGPHDIPRLVDVRLDAGVFAFTLTVSLLTAVLFGLAPALRSSGTELNEGLNERAPVGAGNRHRLRDGLIVAEIALSFIMVIAAGLLLRTLWHLERVNAGFDPMHVLTFSIELPSRYTDQQTSAFYDALLSRLRAVPGAELASAVFPLPFSGNGITTVFDIEGRPSDPTSPTQADLCVAAPDYFRSMHIALLRGRAFENGDGLNGNWIAIVNEAFAKRYFPHEDPLGKRIKSGAESSGTPSRMSKIVGIVADTKVASLREEPKPIVFVPVPQLPIGALSVVVRTQQSRGALLPAVRERVRDIEPAALVFRGKTLEQYLSVSLGQPRFNALLLTVFAALAFLLAIVGLYGSVAYAVAQRTNEIGIRIALGAMPNAILQLVLGHGLRLAYIGGAIGLIGALLLTRVMKNLLFGVGTSDPLTFWGVAALLAAVAIAGCYVPARRAMRIDPLVALRYE